jgi:hypothetical protein
MTTLPGMSLTTLAGYGTAHQRLRAHIKVAVDSGRAKCWRCGKPIHPGQPWDLGHDDHDRNIYRGAEHRHCNRATAGRRRRRRWEL